MLLEFGHSTNLLKHHKVYMFGEQKEVMVRICCF